MRASFFIENYPKGSSFSKPAKIVQKGLDKPINGVYYSSMLRETYLANLKNIPPDAKRIRVARPSVLSPSKELLKCWKYGYLTWDGYTVWYVTEIMNNPKAIGKMREIKDEAKTQDVYLYCYERNPPCHRFILMDLISGMK